MQGKGKGKGDAGVGKGDALGDVGAGKRDGGVSSAYMRKKRRQAKDWQAQIFGEDMPGYVADVGARASQTAGRQGRKQRAGARALFDLAAQAMAMD